MIASETDIATASGSRYLQQLCKHWSHKFDVVFDGNEGLVPFGNDRTCRFHADETRLAIRLSAPTDDGMTRFETVIFDHLKRFAFREDLAVPVWRRGVATIEAPLGAAAESADAPRAERVR